MAKDDKPVYTGIIEKDENGNFFCGEYLLDYKMVTTRFKEGDKIAIKSVIENSSDISHGKYPTKSKDFSLADKKKFIREEGKE